LSGIVHGGSAARVVPQAGAAPPVLVESHLLRHQNTVTGLVMTFSKPMDPVTAQDLSNYEVFPQFSAAGLGATTAIGRPAAVTAAVYDPAHDSVTLILAPPLTIRPRRGTAAGADMFVVQGPSNPPILYVSGITDSSGQALDSNGDGRPDGRLLAYFKAQGSSPNPLSITVQKAQKAQMAAKLEHLRHPYGNSFFGNIANFGKFFAEGGP
jgi:hypothetical protein